MVLSDVNRRCGQRCDTRNVGGFGNHTETLLEPTTRSRTHPTDNVGGSVEKDWALTPTADLGEASSATTRNEVMMMVTVLNGTVVLRSADDAKESEGVLGPMMASRDAGFPTRLLDPLMRRTSKTPTVVLVGTLHTAEHRDVTKPAIGAPDTPPSMG